MEVRPERPSRVRFSRAVTVPANTIMLGDHQRGFAYLKNAAIDQHVVARTRQLDMIEILTDPKKQMETGHKRESLLGLGIDEGTAMVVRGNRFKVIGRAGGSVLVYDPLDLGCRLAGQAQVHSPGHGVGVRSGQANADHLCAGGGYPACG